MTKNKQITPSHLPYPAFVLCPPLYVKSDIQNNIWMQESNEPINAEKFLSQWADFYNVISSNALVFLLPPCPGLQDQTYVNCAAYLPHLKDRDVIILSNFTAEGRAGEELVAEDFLTKLGYEVYQCPYKFEGEPELKYLKDNVYLGGYGIRTELKALEWIEQTFNCKIIKIHEYDEYLYHLDCSVFVIDKDNILAYTQDWPKATLKAVQTYCTVHPVSEEAAYSGICNSVRVNEIIYNGSSVKFMKPTDKWYKEELIKNQELVSIVSRLGYETMFFDISEATKSGALLSCFVMTLRNPTSFY